MNTLALLENLLYCDMASLGAIGGGLFSFLKTSFPSVKNFS